MVAGTAARLDPRPKQRAGMGNLFALPEGTELVGDYRIQRVLGAGGFGVTYLADEIALGRAVTIKEYFPSDFAARSVEMEAGPRSQDCKEDYKWGLDRFLDEAQTLARFDHPNIVRVYRYFRLNNTGYMVLQFEEGHSLKGWLKSLGRAPRQKELDAILAPLLDALELIHKSDFLHRDIAPDNIIIRRNGEPVLIDFGAARGEIAAHSKTVSALVKPGYSPYEQYAETSRQQGPWSDIYALGATLYHAITGRRPPDAPSRMVKDELVPARDAALSSYRASFLRAIDRALALNVESRPQSVAAWRGDLLAPEPPKPGWLTRALEKKRDSEPEPFIGAASRVAVVPPPPDAPGPHGGMLDFVEGLKQRNESPASVNSPKVTEVLTVEPSEAHAAAEKPDTAPPPAPAFLRGKDKKAKSGPQSGPKSGPKSGAKSGPKSDPAMAAAAAKISDLVPVAEPVERRKPPRPKPIRGERSRWRPLLFKLAVGVGVASAAVFVQDRLPQGEKRTNAMPSSQTAAVAPPLAPPVLISQLKGHKGAVGALAYSDDGRLIVTTGTDATLRIWNASAATLLRTIDIDVGPATSVAVSGNRAVTGHADGRAVLWDLARGEKLGSYRRNEASVWSVAFAGSPDRFVATGHDWKVALWDAKNSSAPAHVFEGHESAAQAVAFDPKGTLLATGGADKTVRLWNLETLDLVRTYKGMKDYVTAVAFSPDGRMIASSSLDGSIRLLSTVSSRHFRTLLGHKSRVGSLAFAPSGEYLASAGEDGTVRVWDFKRGRTARTFLGHQGPVKTLAYSPDGSRIASAGEDGTIRIWSAQITKRD